ncbi:MAG: phosphate ABC transporter substrate-binding protein [candidate division WOR-3 bacterium]|nr:MAG: phosphate ABC transporter substrate-binding protein [candidate division WOR-3 bacterium]
MRLFLVVVSLCVMNCAPNKGGVIIAGSTSVQPFIEKVAEHFMEKYPDITINVQGGGSTAGVQATMNGTCDIGTSSRNLKPTERGLKVILIALDGIAVIVHRSSPVGDLSVERIRRIFSGHQKEWNESGIAGNVIIPVTREEGSGTRASFEEMIMGDEAISDACLVQDSNGAVREIIATTPQGVGYISVGLVDEREKAVAIEGIKPTLANLITEKYRFARPFLLLLREEPTGNVKKFIDYVLSEEGQEILAGSGLIPANKVAAD